MEYVVLVVAGLIGGFFVPLRPKALLLGVLLAGLFLAVVTVYAVAHNHSLPGALSFLVLPQRVPVSEPGLGALVVGAGIWVISIVVGAVRLLFSRSRASQAESHRRAA